jgi:hypothetical protein
MDNLKIYDQQGQERDWNWLVANFGEVRLQRAQIPQGVTKAYRIVKLTDAVGVGAQSVNVVNQQGKPLAGIRVVRHWPDAPPLPDWPAPTSRWHTQGVFGPTNVNGDIGFGMGQGDFYTLPNVGASSVWVADPSGPSDLVSGLGMVTGGNYRHLNLQFQLQESTPTPPTPPQPPEPEPPPPPSPSPPPPTSDENWQTLFEKLDRIIALLEEYCSR